jgi:hypothetical protein
MAHSKFFWGGADVFGLALTSSVNPMNFLGLPEALVRVFLVEWTVDNIFGELQCSIPVGQFTSALGRR